MMPDEIKAFYSRRMSETGTFRKMHFVVEFTLLPHLAMRPD